MIDNTINKSAVAFAVLAQVLCLWMLHVISRLAQHAYRIMFPDLPLPWLTEISIHTGIIVFGIIFAFGTLLVFTIFRKASPSVRTGLMVIFVSAELFLLLVMCWAYLLPFGYMTATR